MRDQHPACSDKNPDFAFDLGTSPHGLPAGLLLPLQKTSGASGSYLPVGQQAPKGRAESLAEALPAPDSRKVAGSLPAPQDLKATDSLWHKLEDVMVQRMKGVCK